MKKTNHIKSSLIAFVLFVFSYSILFGDIYLNRSHSQPETQILGAETTVNSLSLSSKISSINKNENGSYTIAYVFEIKNSGEKEVTDIQVSANFNGTFPNNNFSITDKKSPDFTISSGYNGLGNTALLSGHDKLLPGSSSSMFITLTFNPLGEKGPFENKVEASGLIEGEKVVTQTQTSADSKDEKKEEKDKEEIKPEKKPDEKPKEEPKPAPPPPVETNLEPRDITFILFNADTDEDMYEITEGMVLDFNNDIKNNISIKIVVTPGTKGSLRVGLNGNPNYRIENLLPYYITHNGADFADAWQFTEGKQELTGTAMTERKGEGKVISSKTINFEIVGKVPQIAKNENEGSGDDNNKTAYLTTSGAASSYFVLPEEVIPEVVIEEEPTEPVVLTPNSIWIDQVPQVDEEIVEPSITPIIVSNAIAGEPIITASAPQQPVQQNEGRVLAATGINLSKTFIIGAVLIIAVLELNLYKKERNLLKGLAKSL